MATAGPGSASPEARAERITTDKLASRDSDRASADPGGCTSKRGGSVRYLVFVPLRRPTPRPQPTELTRLIRLIAFSIGILLMLAGAAAVAIVMWDAFGGR
jgi:hypothetical protein